MNKQPHEDNSTHGSDYIDHATSSVYDHNAEEGITHDADGSGSNVEDWDLTSPLLLRTDQFGADQNQDDFQQFQHDKQQVQEEYGHIYTETGTEPQSEDQDEGVTTPTVPAASVYEYYRTTLAATFTMTFVILVAGSYFFEWSDTILRVQVETAIATKDDMDESYDIQQGKSLSVDLPLYTDATFQTTLGIFQSSKSNLIVLLIIVSSLVAPILFMVIQPCLIIIISNVKPSIMSSQNDRGNQKFWHDRRIFSLVRITLSIMEVVMKLSMSIVFVNSILNVCTSKVKFVMGGDDFGPTELFNNNNPINVFVVNNPRGGLISYMIGLSFFGIAAMKLIRAQMAFDGTDNPSDEIKRQHVSNDDVVVLALNSGNEAILSPPPSAFKQHREHFRNCAESNRSHDNIEIVTSSSMDHFECNHEALSRSMPKDDEMSSSLDRPTTSEEEQIQPFLLEEERNEEDEYVTESEHCQKQSKKSLLELLHFESGLLSFLLLLPLSSMPLIRLEYTGLLTTLLDKNILEKTTLTFLDIAQTIVSSNNNGKDLFGFVTIMFYWSNIVIIPLITWALSSVIWFFAFIWRKENKTLATLSRYLRSLQQFVFLTPFAISLFVTVASVHLVTDFLFNQNDACKKIQHALQMDPGSDQCMLVKGHLLPGSYILLIQAFCADLFVILLNSI